MKPTGFCGKADETGRFSQTFSVLMSIKIFTNPKYF